MRSPHQFWGAQPQQANQSSFDCPSGSMQLGVWVLVGCAGRYLRSGRLGKCLCRVHQSCQGALFWTSKDMYVGQSHRHWRKHATSAHIRDLTLLSVRWTLAAKHQSARGYQVRHAAYLKFGTAETPAAPGIMYGPKYMEYANSGEN